MLASQLIQPNYPSLGIYDKVSFALQLMDDYDVQHLPVMNEDKYAGLVAKDDLLDADESAMLASLEEQFLKVSVKKEEYFLSALKIAANNQLSLIPVVNEAFELSGVIPANNLLQYTSHFVGNEEPGGLIVLAIERRNYSFGEISRLVETNDAYITQLNTYTEQESGLIIATLKINKIELSDIIATFQRYEYIIRYYFGEEQYANELKENYNHLMTYLNV